MTFLECKRGGVMKKYHIWHNTNGIADQYFVAEDVTGLVKFQIPRWLGRILKKLFF